MKCYTERYIQCKRKQFHSVYSCSLHFKGWEISLLFYSFFKFFPQNNYECIFYGIYWRTF